MAFESLKRNEEVQRQEWGELWPDGSYLPVHHNSIPVGWPDRPPPNSHRGTKWVRRWVVYGAWGVWPDEDPL